MSVGPRKPPRFAMLTTNAIPAAAGAPARKRVGVDQNGPEAEQCPIGTSARENTARMGCCKSTQPKNPAPETNNGIAMCRGRSSLRSEWALLKSIKTIVAALIAPKMRTTLKSLLLVRDFITSGDQNE